MTFNRLQPRFDLAILPTPEASENSWMPASTLRFYESSKPGMATVVMYDKHNYMQAATRLTREQVATLRDNLEDYLVSTL